MTSLRAGAGAPPTGERHRVKAADLRRRCDPGVLGFASTEEVAPLDGEIGQERALEAVDFALGIPGRGYNLFVTGATGTGKRTMLEQRLGAAAADRPTPSDWVYLFNFDDPARPLGAELPSGRGRELAGAMARFVDDARKEIPRAFESSSYQKRRREIEEDVEGRREAGLAEVRRFAQDHGLALELTPAGVAMVPLVDGQPLSRAQFEALPAEAKQAHEESRRMVERRMTEFMATVRGLEREARERIGALDREVALFAAGHLVDDVGSAFADVPAVTRWLDDVREDVIDHVGQFRTAGAGQEVSLPEALAARAGAAAFFGRYEVNVFLEHAGEGAPVVAEVNPTYHSLFGRIEYESVFGALATDHRHLRAGAIHRANGGYLLLDAVEVVTRPFLWDKLKEALRTGQAKLENLGEQFTLFPTATLTPQAIPLDLKVVLLGRPDVYRLLYLLDEDVRELFRVKSEFDVTMPWTDDGVRAYAAFIAARVRADGLCHFRPEAVARVVEQAARNAGHREKLSTRFAEIADLVAEACHWAAEGDAELVGPEHVERAVAQRIRRSNLVEDKLDELVSQGTLAIDVEGSHVGQVNGLAVIELGDYDFARPVRVTATTAAGPGKLVSIDRETKLSGSLHDKGFLTVSGFLQERYGQDLPLSLAASLTFEQSYDEVEGDSAASAELYALLSSLAGAPVSQGVAVTGSVNQYGEVQAIGAINEKVEGFYEICRRKGLTGAQGVVLPRANLPNLMLRDEVASAAEEGRFHVWAVGTVDEGIEVLTGLPAGARGPDGRYPPGSVHARVQERLAALAETARRFAHPEDGRRQPSE